MSEIQSLFSETYEKSKSEENITAKIISEKLSTVKSLIEGLAIVCGYYINGSDEVKDYCKKVFEKWSKSLNENTYKELLSLNNDAINEMVGINEKPSEEKKEDTYNSKFNLVDSSKTVTINCDKASSLIASCPKETFEIIKQKIMPKTYTDESVINNAEIKLS